MKLLNSTEKMRVNIRIQLKQPGSKRNLFEWFISNIKILKIMLFSPDPDPCIMVISEFNFLILIRFILRRGSWIVWKLGSVSMVLKVCRYQTDTNFSRQRCDKNIFLRNRFFFLRDQIQTSLSFFFLKGQSQPESDTLFIIYKQVFFL